MSNEIRILLVEDDVDIAAIIQATLRSLPGLKIHHVITGDAALKACDQQAFDVALLDYRLPGMNGDELQRALQAHREARGMPVAFLTANTQSGDRARLIGQGAVAVFAKPFKPAELREQVAQMLMALGFDLTPVSPSKSGNAAA